MTSNTTVAVCKQSSSFHFNFFSGISNAVPRSVTISHRARYRTGCWDGLPPYRWILRRVILATWPIGGRKLFGWVCQNTVVWYTTARWSRRLQQERPKREGQTERWLSDESRCSSCFFLFFLFCLFCPFWFSCDVSSSAYCQKISFLGRACRCLKGSKEYLPVPGTQCGG